MLFCFDVVLDDNIVTAGISRDGTLLVAGDWLVYSVHVSVRG